MSGHSRRWFAAIVSVGAVVIPVAARAAVIATYWFPGADPAGDATVPTAAHATFSPVTRVGLDAVDLAYGFSSSDYTSSPTIDLADSYIEFTVTADPGYKLELESLTFYFTRVDQNHDRTGPQKGTVRASFESFLDGSGTGDDFFPKTTEQHTTWDFTDYTSPAGGSATFRIYGWDAVGITSPNMRLVIDDIALGGSVVHAPEPSALVALAPLAPLAVMWRRARGISRRT